MPLPGGLVAKGAAALGALVGDGGMDVAVVATQGGGVGELLVTA